MHLTRFQLVEKQLATVRTHTCALSWTSPFKSGSHSLSSPKCIVGTTIIMLAGDWKPCDVLISRSCCFPPVRLGYVTEMNWPRGTGKTPHKEWKPLRSQHLHLRLYKSRPSGLLTVLPDYVSMTLESTITKTIVVFTFLNFKLIPILFFVAYSRLCRHCRILAEREVVSCRDFTLRSVATFWVMSLVGIYPGRAS